LQITEDRRNRVIDLYFNQHKSYAEIAQIERISPRNIHAIIKEEEARRQKHEDQQRQEELSSKAYKLFSEGKRPVQVAITLNLGQPEVTRVYGEYWRLKRLHILNSIYKETNGKLSLFLKLYRLMKEKGMSVDQVVNAVGIAIHKIPHMGNLYEQVTDQINKMQRTRQGLVNDIEERKNKISILYQTAFSIEQECKRTEQRVQELYAQKDRLEKLIADILNGEGYTMIKQIVKDNVKTVLSDKKILISISFVALIQTIKADPQMVKLIQNIHSANDSEQHNDNNNNIIKYIEANKNSILHLTEKNYENLVEALTNNAINSAASSSNFTLSLSSSSTFPNLSNQSDMYKIKDSESFHHSRGDIAD
jgi:hypothetical protein